MKISNSVEYAEAINRANILRGEGATAETCAELAALQGALEAYAMLPDQPDESKGKPTADPYDHIKDD